MINNLLLSFTTDKTNSIDLNSIFPKTETKTVKADNGFGDILSSKINSYDRKENTLKAESNKEFKERTVDQKNKTKDTYGKTIDSRDLERSHKVKTEDIPKVDENKQVNETKHVNEDDSLDDVTHKDDNIDMTVKLAAALDLKPEELSKILTLLDIKPQDLNSLGISEISQKLSDLMGLDSKQTSTLEWLLSNVDTQLESSNKSTLELKNSIKEGFVKLEGVDVEVINLNDDQEFKSMLDKLKAKLDDASTKIESDPETFKNEFSKKLESYINTFAKNENNASESKIADEPLENKVEIRPILKEKVEAKGELNQDNKGEEEADTPNKGQSQIEVKGDKTVLTDNPKLAVKASIITGSEKQEDIASLNKDSQYSVTSLETQKTNSKTIFEIPKTTIASKSDIINQFVEKAKVVLNHDKSEMTMDLKPENLGKLSLKVVTENGIVTAKFLAESQQVKEVLESNMQLLKDSLEKQGISIQGFSVNVGQDSSKNPGENRNYNSSKNENSNLGKISNFVNSGKRISAFEDSQNVNPYMSGETSINLMA